MSAPILVRSIDLVFKSISAMDSTPFSAAKCGAACCGVGVHPTDQTDEPLQLLTAAQTTKALQLVLHEAPFLPDALVDSFDCVTIAGHPKERAAPAALTIREAALYPHHDAQSDPRTAPGERDTCLRQR